jgi:hypothetical protein
MLIEGFSCINGGENVAGAVIQQLFRQRDAERSASSGWPRRSPRTICEPSGAPTSARSHAHR